MGFHKPQILNNNSLYNFDRANSNEQSSKSKLGPKLANSVTHKVQNTKTLSSSVGFKADENIKQPSAQVNNKKGSGNLSYGMIGFNSSIVRPKSTNITYDKYMKAT
jgi:hypothetical protein